MTTDLMDQLRRGLNLTENCENCGGPLTEGREISSELSPDSFYCIDRIFCTSSFYYKTKLVQYDLVSKVVAELRATHNECEIKIILDNFLEEDG